MSQAPAKGTDSELRVPCEIYSRIVGYLRPVDAWNAGKQQEYRERVAFAPEKADADPAA
jgi:anaerobic ribonucleoside-triphosphate reductase